MFAQGVEDDAPPPPRPLVDEMGLPMEAASKPGHKR